MGEVKSQTGMPIYVPSRESEMIAARREQAKSIGVSPDLAEDVLRRVIRLRIIHSVSILACRFR